MASKSVIQLPGVMDFVQYAARYCALVEPSTTPTWTAETVNECRRMLAWVYSTGLALPDFPFDPYIQLERTIREQDYEVVRSHIEEVLGEHDRFLNAQMEEMKYSDRPVSVSTAEVLADIYQALGDFVWVFRSQNDRSMLQAVAEIKYTMLHEWGTLLLAAVRQLHDLLINPDFVLGNEEDWQ